MNIIEKTYSLNGGLIKRSATNRIFLHHSACSSCSADDIDRWHKAKGWTCIGYHFLVRKDGSIYRGRQEDCVGAHAYGANMDSIGICAEGNFEEETMSETQKNSLKELVAYLKNKYNISKVQKHKDVCATACPGRNYPFDEIANSSEQPHEKQSNATQNEGYTVTIATDVLRIREGASTDTAQVGHVNRGEVYTIVETKRNWGRLKSGAGWICLDYTDKEQKDTSKYVLGKYVVNARSGLNVRSGAGTNYSIKKTYTNGTRFDTYEIKGNWARTPSGWVCLDYCKLINKY